MAGKSKSAAYKAKRARYQAGHAKRQQLKEEQRKLNIPKTGNKDKHKHVYRLTKEKKICLKCDFTKERLTSD
jgi:hypothetical protein